MEKRVSIFDDTNQIGIQQIGDEDCLLEFAGDRMLLSYEAAYDLAIRLAMFVQKIDSGEANESAAPLLN